MNCVREAPGRKRVFFTSRMVSRQKGFTLLEILVAMGIIGIISLAFYPSILNTLETRKLESTARNIMTNLQRAKFQAVTTRLNHRVTFEYVTQGSTDTWTFTIEREDTPGNWSVMPGFLRKSIPAEFDVTVNVPDQMVEFSSLGFVSNYSTTQNTISVRSSKLNSYNQPDERTLSVFIGGSIQYAKGQSGD